MRARKCDDPHACRRASKCTRPRYAKFNTKKLLLQPSKLKMWWKMKQNLPISSSFKRFVPKKMFHKIFPQKILPWKNESISCTNLLFLKKWIFSCFMSNLKEKKLETKQKNCRKWPRLSCYKNDTMCTTILNEKKKNRSSAHKKKTVLYINWKKINFLKNRL